MRKCLSHDERQETAVTVGWNGLGIGKDGTGSDEDRTDVSTDDSLLFAGPCSSMREALDEAAKWRAPVSWPVVPSFRSGDTGVVCSTGAVKGNIRPFSIKKCGKDLNQHCHA